MIERVRGGRANDRESERVSANDRESERVSVHNRERERG